MKKVFLLLLLIGLLFKCTPSPQEENESKLRKNIPLDSITMSDPAILADFKTQMYYITGTSGKLWGSKDLKLWTDSYDAPNSFITFI